MTDRIQLSEKNQPIWAQFKAEKLEEILSKQEEKTGSHDPKAAGLNIAQYHEVALCLNTINPDWQTLTAEQVEKCNQQKPTKKNHVNGLLIRLYVNGWIKINRDIAVNIIPAEYRQLVKMIL